MCGVQAQVQEQAMSVSEMDDAIGELHRQLEFQLLQKLDQQDQIRCKVSTTSDNCCNDERH